MNKFFLAVALLIAGTAACAQAPFEGKIIYDMEVNSPDIPPEAASMMPKEAVIYIKDKLSRVEMDMAMSKLTVIADNERNTATSLVNVMGKKIAVQPDSAKVAEAIEKIGKYEIKYLNESKDIAGYSCKKALIILNDGADTSTIWYTKDIPAVKTSMNQHLPQVDGFAMSMTAKQQGVDMKMTVREVHRETVDDSLFEIPEDYEIIKQDEIQQKLMGN